MQQRALRACGPRTSGVRPVRPASNNRSAMLPVRAAAADTSAEQASTSTSFRHGITHTSYEGNSWAARFNNSGVHMLVDPWLEGDLTFFGQDWVYRGKKRLLNTPRGGKVNIDEIVADTDLVVLSQYLDDHLHLPTIKKLPRTMPIVANPEAADIVKGLGFSNVTVVDHGQTVEVANGRLRITATAGSLVGPPWSKRQNTYTFREVVPGDKDGALGASIFYEPHCDFVESQVAKLGKVDVVITPIKSTLLGQGAVAYPIVLGDANLIKLLQLLKPKVLVPLMNADIDQEGPLSEYVFDRGSVEEARQKLRKSGLPTRLEMPAPPGESLAIAL